MKEKKIFNVEIEEGDAIIRLRNNKVVQLVFAEDGDTIVREMAWPDHEVYKAAVQFALMIDSYFKNGEGLDNLPLADRATITNMAPEYGATCGFFPVDDEALLVLFLLVPVGLEEAGLEEDSIESTFRYSTLRKSFLFEIQVAEEG